MKKGFTLIEMLVASAMLIIAMIAITAAFTSMVRTQRHALDAQHLLDQGGYAMEYMSKALRMAKKEIRDTSPCLTYTRNYQAYLGGVKFISLDESPRCRAFFVESGILMDREEGRSPENLPLTSSSVEVVDFSATIEDGEGIQPRVKMILKIRPAGSDFPELELETTISQRDLNIPID